MHALLVLSSPPLSRTGVFPDFPGGPTQASIAVTLQGGQGDAEATADCWDNDTPELLMRNKKTVPAPTRVSSAKLEMPISLTQLFPTRRNVELNPIVPFFIDNPGKHSCTARAFQQPAAPSALFACQRTTLPRCSQP